MSKLQKKERNLQNYGLPTYKEMVQMSRTRCTPYDRPSCYKLRHAKKEEKKNPTEFYTGMFAENV